EKKHVVFIAGTGSHGYGAHEHKAGCLLLADELEKSDLGVRTTVITEGWPKDDTVLDTADAVVVYADGGKRHPLVKHLDRVNELMERGKGLVGLHYAVEVPKGKPGDAFLNWIGGYFEEWWSVNPSWVADFQQL